MAEFDLQILFRNTFPGVYINPKFDVEKLTPQPTQSKLGIPYFANVDGREYFLPVKIDGLQMPVPLMTLGGAKTIVETPMVARKGAVNELISIDNYRITLRGICLGDNGAWPEDRVDELKQKWEIDKALDIESVLTGIFGIEHVILKTISFPETRGFKGMVGYQMELTSDELFELTIK